MMSSAMPLATPLGYRYLAAEEIAQVQRVRADKETQRSDQLVEYLRSLGIDPDNLPSNS
jgi:hypothetical protein